MILFSRSAGWDHSYMGENSELEVASSPVTGQMKTVSSGHLDGFGSPITQQMRIVGQRRRDAEEKLEHHLQEARAKHPSDHPDAGEPDAPDPVG
jgi:hypothetical protein